MLIVKKMILMIIVELPIVTCRIPGQVVSDISSKNTMPAWNVSIDIGTVIDSRDVVSGMAYLVGKRPFQVPVILLGAKKENNLAGRL